MRWLNGPTRGDDMGLVRHLALRREPNAMAELARLLADSGSAARPYSAAGLAYRAFRQGHPVAAYNQAMRAFNNRDMQGYRRWLRRAADVGDEDARTQLRRFETRLPHGAARDIRKGRPYRSKD